MRLEIHGDFLSAAVENVVVGGEGKGRRKKVLRNVGGKDNGREGKKRQGRFVVARTREKVPEPLY